MAYTFDTLGLPEDLLMALKAKYTPITSVTPLKKGITEESPQQKMMADMFQKLDETEKKALLFPELAQKQLEERKMESFLQQQQEQREITLFDLGLKAEAQDLDRMGQEFDMQLKQVELELEAEKFEYAKSQDMQSLISKSTKGSKQTPNQYFGNLLEKEGLGELTEVEKKQLGDWKESKLQDSTDKLEYERKKLEMELQNKQDNYEQLKQQGVGHTDALARSGLAQLGSPEVAGKKSEAEQRGKLEARYNFYLKLLKEGYSNEDAKEMAGMKKTRDSESDFFTKKTPIVPPKLNVPSSTSLDDIIKRKQKEMGN
jgi:hypothetical protein